MELGIKYDDKSAIHKKVMTINGAKRSVDVKLSDFNFKVGDLVSVSGQGLESGGVIYRIVKDYEPAKDAVYSIITSPSRRYTRTRTGWAYPNESKRKNKRLIQVPHIKLDGCISLRPEFAFMPSRKTDKLRTVPYSQIMERVTKVDIVSLGATFATYQNFINEELAKLIA